MRRTLATAAATAVVVTVTAASAVGCDSVQKALDCANTAVTVAESAQDLQTAVSSATENPAEARQALDRIDKNLDKIDDSTGNADVNKATGDLNDAVDEARSAIDEGRAPDVKAVTNAADELTKVCSPG